MCGSLVSLISNRQCWTIKDVQQILKKNRVVVFARGKQDSPSNGYCKEVLEELSTCKSSFKYVNVDSEKTILSALKAYSGTNHLPLLYVAGELVSNSDIQIGKHRQGEFGKLIREVA